MTNLNGVKMETIEGLVKNYQDNPEDAVAGWSSKITWQEGFHTQAKIGEFEPINIDEPTWLSGTNKGPNPVEFLLSSLGGCISAGFIATASGMGIQINSLEVNVSGQIDLKVFLGLREGNSGFDDIDVQFIVDSDADDKIIEELVVQSLKISPVTNSLQRNVQVNSTFERKK